MKFISHLDQVIPYVAGEPIEVVAQRYGLSRVIKLASNESPLPPFPEVAAEIAAKFNDLNRYPDSECRALRAALAARFQVGQDEIIIANGSCELLLLLSLILLEPGTEAVFSDPTFLMYEEVTLARGAQAVKVPLKDFHNDLAAMAAAVNERTRIVFLTNPHNPTGTYLPVSEIAAFAAGLPDGCLLVLDEAYNEYVAQADSQDGLKLRAARQNVVVLRTFSKIYGLCGLRVGYGFCSPEIKAAIDKVRQPFNVNLLAQAAALKALSLEERLAERRRLNQAGRDQLYRGLKELGLTHVETQSNFMLIDVGGLATPADSLPEELMRRGVIVRNATPFGCPGYIRVSVGTEEENRFFLDRLTELK